MKGYHSVIKDESDMMSDPIAAWNKEYDRQGIPSSHRDEPSGVLRWALSNLPYLVDEPVQSAVDLGCGTGRNAIALSDAGLSKISGMDFSKTALEVARKRPGSDRVTFMQGDVTNPLPFEGDSFDLATDIFVYFHQLTDTDRARYRREIHRVLKPGGVVLISLATNNDGYYSSCSIGPLSGLDSSVRLTWDPIAEVGNILLSYSQLLAEFSDLFEFEMSWIKRKAGKMHGVAYSRETVGTLWRAKVRTES
jgi:SAM-dependent methyltransferase